MASSDNKLHGRFVHIFTSTHGRTNMFSVIKPRKRMASRKVYSKNFKPASLLTKTRQIQALKIRKGEIEEQLWSIYNQPETDSKMMSIVVSQLISQLNLIDSRIMKLQAE